MEQQNSILLDTKEESQVAVEDTFETTPNSELFDKVRQNFSVFGSISLIFGAVFTLCFYNADIGLNAFFYALVMVILLILIMIKLTIPIKKATILYYIGTVLLGLSCMLSASDTLQFLNVIGMLLLLELSLIHQMYEKRNWDMLKYIKLMLVFPFHCLATIAFPFVDAYEFLKHTKVLKNQTIRNVFIGIVITIPLLGIIIGLLSSADLLFGEMTNKIYSSNIFLILLMTLFGYLACYCIICGSTTKDLFELNSSEKKADASIAITILVMLCFVYMIFCGLQVVYLFNKGLFELPAEFSYSEYARRGFFELLTVTVINVSLMLICTTWFKENKGIRVLLTVMTGCTYIMIGSAVYRMLLYISSYNLTFLRLWCLVFLLIDSLVLGGIIIFVYNKKFPLVGYMVSVFTICYLLFAFAKPDYLIASYNIENKRYMLSDDRDFLTNQLSIDAAPVVIPYLKQINDTNSENLNNYIERIKVQTNGRGIRDFNVSNYIAKKAAR